MKTKLVFIGLALAFCISCGKEEPKTTPNPTPVPVETEVPVETPKEVKAPRLVYTVQIGAYKKSNTSLSNLADVQVMNEQGLTKYRLGTFETYRQAKAYKNTIRSQYPDAFIQALENNSPIGITRALSLEN